MPINSDITFKKINECAVCHYAKQVRLLFPTTYIKSTSTFELMHMDV